MKLILTILLILICVFAQGQNKEPRNIQARVYEITKVKGNKVECKALSMDGFVINIKYTFRGWVGKRKIALSITPGTWLTIHSYYNDKFDEWICRRISIN